MKTICIILSLLCIFVLITSEPTQKAFSQTITNDNSDDTFQNGITNRSNGITVVAAAGDIECSSRLDARIKIDNPTIFVALGDLCYKEDLSNFMNKFNDLKVADKFECVIGNHEAEENGNSKILRQALDFCGDHWYRKIANNSTLLIGLNTNGDTSLQSDWAQSLVTNSTFMNGIKNVMLISHKPAHTPPGSEHQAEDSTVKMFTSITNRIPNEIHVFEIAAHNHLMAESSNGQWFVSGGGGRKLYSFTIDPEWSFISNIDHGYLQIKINNTDGRVLSTGFQGLNGRPLFNENPLLEVSENMLQSVGKISNIAYEACNTNDQTKGIRVVITNVKDDSGQIYVDTSRGNSSGQSAWSSDTLDILPDSDGNRLLIDTSLKSIDSITGNCINSNDKVSEKEGFIN
jgi:Calcineurin-like phosphoesterase